MEWFQFWGFLVVYVIDKNFTGGTVQAYFQADYILFRFSFNSPSQLAL